MRPSLSYRPTVTMRAQARAVRQALTVPKIRDRQTKSRPVAIGEVIQDTTVPQAAGEAS